MARRDKPAPGDTPGTRVPALLALVVIALAYQQSPYVPAQLEPVLHVAVPILASLLLTQLSVRAMRSVLAGVRAVADRLQDGELVVRLRRSGRNRS
jgi:hypothetical protein